MSQQSLRQASIRAVTGTALTYEGDWHALFDLAAIAAGPFNQRLLAWINYHLTASYTELNGAMAALAAANSASPFQGLGTFGLGAASALLGAETNGVAIDFTDASMVIRDTVTSANNFSGNPFSKLTFTRGSAARYYNSAGLIVSAAINVPRYDYYPTTLLPRGLLLEEARTNSALQSEVLGTTWVPSNITVGTNTGNGADGAATADRLTATAGNGTLLQTVTTTAIPWTFSIWLRRITGTGNVDISCDGTTWATKTLTTTLTRFETTLTMLAAPSTCGIRIVTSGDVIEAWGGQLEAGGFASSYIPTTTIAVTRSADTTSLAGTLLPLSQLTGTMILEGEHAGTVRATGTASVTGSIILGDGTANERITIDIDNNAGSSRMLVTDGGVTQATINIAGVVINTVYKVGVVYALNDFHQARDGTLGTPDTAGTLPTTTNFYFGSVTGSALNTVWYRRAVYLPRRVTNTELQVKTTP